jgi:hypothetical protein
MAKVEMIRRNRVFSVDARLAPLLEAHGGYQRRDMQAQPAAAPLAASQPEAPDVAKQPAQTDGGKPPRTAAKKAKGAAGPKTAPAKDEI